MDEIIRIEETGNGTVEAPAQNSIIEALARAQGAYPPIKKNKWYKISNAIIWYADLDAILNGVMPVLAHEGIAITWRYENLPSGSIGVECVLRRGLETLSSGMIAVPKANGNNPVQAMGSALTYGRRYTLCAVGAICAGDDDDGASATTNAEAKPAPQKAPDPVECPADLEAKARTSALMGTEAYQALFSAISPRERNLLAKSGKHAEFKKLAETVGNGNKEKAE